MMQTMRNLSRLMLITACLASAWVPCAAFAKDKGAGNTASEKSAKPEASSQKDKAPPGQAKKEALAPGQGKNGLLPATDADAAIALPQVSTNSALSLAELRAAVAELSTGRLLDVVMVRIKGIWVYDVTVLEVGNVTRHVLVDARTGNAVER